VSLDPSLCLIEVSTNRACIVLRSVLRSVLMSVLMSVLIGRFLYLARRLF